jgi:competence protein ComEA
MDHAPVVSGPPPPATALTAVPPPAPPVLPPQLSRPLAPSALRDAWPRSAQWATAFLLGAALALLSIHSIGYLRGGSRPAELQRGLVLSYRVDLNRARRAELLQLPGVGDRMAERIEDYRRAGVFRSVDELMKVRGIGSATVERLRPWVFVAAEEPADEPEPAGMDVKPLPMAAKRPATPPRGVAPLAKSKKAGALTERIDINRASPEDLQRLPGIGPKLSQRIADERRKAAFKTVAELRRVPGIGAKTLERLLPYIKVQAVGERVVAAE